MPLVSVIIPTFNRANIISDAIDSVLDQTFTDFELIVVDDGSTDQTKEVISNYHDPRLRYIQQVNRGVAAARNVGIAAARGQLIALLDSDDRFLPEKLRYQVDLWKKDPTIGLVYGQYYGESVSGAGRKLLGNCDPKIQLDRLLLGPVFHTSTLLIVRKWLDKIGGFDEDLRVGEEWELSIRLAIAGCPMKCVPYPLSEVRLQVVGLSRETYQHWESVAAVLDKTFSMPEMPAKLLQMQNLCCGSLAIRHSVSAYLANDTDAGKELLKNGLNRIDSNLESPEVDLLIERFVSHLKGLSLEDPRTSLSKVSENLPGEKIYNDKLRRKLWQKFYLESAFLAYAMGQRLSCVRYSMRSVIQSPTSLQNRGLISIFFRSLFGSWFVKSLKSSSSLLEK